MSKYTDKFYQGLKRVQTEVETMSSDLEKFATLRNFQVTTKEDIEFKFISKGQLKEWREQLTMLQSTCHVMLDKMMKTMDSVASKR